MNHRGLMFYTTLLVMGSAVVASQAMRQQRLARASNRRHDGQVVPTADEPTSGQTTPQPDLDTSLTSRSIPP